MLYFDGCPHWEAMDRLLGDLGSEYGLTLAKEEVGSREEAEAIAFRGSPTVLLDGVDPFADPSAPIGLSCRLYATPEGLSGMPTTDMMRRAIESAQDG